jgi:hypothetical protein
VGQFEITLSADGKERGRGVLISSLPFEVWTNDSRLSLIPQEKGWPKETNYVQNKYIIRK